MAGGRASVWNAAALALALVACARDAHPDLTHIQEKIDAACATGLQRLPASQIFEREASLCYAYETVQDVPITIGPGRWVDRSRIRGEDSASHTTFDLTIAAIATADGASVRFYDEAFQCHSTDTLIAVRADSQAFVRGGCGWLVGTTEQINSALALQH